MTESIGTINIDTGIICVTDPCYDYGSAGLAAWGLNILPGVYNCYVEFATVYGSDDYIKAIYISHIDYSVKNPEYWPIMPFNIAVDSGQAGFFKDSIYDEFEYIDTDKFYDECCAKTLSIEGYGLVADNRGFLSTSGFGDGSYTFTYQKNDQGEIYALGIIFIPENEPEKDDWFNEEEEDDLEEVIIPAFLIEEEESDIARFEARTQDDFNYFDELDDFEVENSATLSFIIDDVIPDSYQDTLDSVVDSNTNTRDNFIQSEVLDNSCYDSWSNDSNF